MPVLASDIALERMTADRVWSDYARLNNLPTSKSSWLREDSPAGPLLSCQIHIPKPIQALEGFAASLSSGGDSNLRAEQAQLDYTQPGRVACVWLSHGVWLELWADDRPETPAVRPTARRAALTAKVRPVGPSAPLPTRRRSLFARRTKETTA
ncbi:hypothetical protein [Streptomyces sp. NPDC008150]|uniref:hypothetical protein n=1 Tax=Streptomyces sp. NPDC008150 TaxID=3364816 RepID=UPI0036E143B1